MINFAIDCETTGVSSNSVLLSIGIIKFELNVVPDRSPVDFYQELINSSLFVKFDVEEQVTRYHRTVNKETLEWWSKQSSDAKHKSLIPNSSKDHTLVDGVFLIQDYIRKATDGVKSKSYFWQRGSLDQIIIDDVCNSIKQRKIAPYNVWRDFRTAIDILCENSEDGYCMVKGFNKEIVQKHNPVHDCAYDILQLLYRE